MKNNTTLSKQFQTSNTDIVEKDKFDTTNTQIHDSSLSRFGTVNCDVVHLVIWCGNLQRFLWALFKEWSCDPWWRVARPTFPYLLILFRYLQSIERPHVDHLAATFFSTQFIVVVNLPYISWHTAHLTFNNNQSSVCTSAIKAHVLFYERLSAFIICL